jgi:drug/metabolite transporter (DMT)-like permease
MNQALKEAESHVVLPLDFSRLIWATLIGLLVFAELPGVSVWIGGAMIIASAAYVGERERRLRRSKQKVIA